MVGRTIFLSTNSLLFLTRILRPMIETIFVTLSNTTATILF
jgi:hypothetical protein